MSDVSIRNGLLALLSERARYGAQLRAEFETRTGGTWPLNVGQVYTTLRRLERDGLAEPAGPPDPEGRIAYRLTDAGQRELEQWWFTPTDRVARPRDELTIKLALAVTIPGVDVARVVQMQRTQCLRGLQHLTRLKQQAHDEDDIAWLLVLDNLVFTTEAEVRWLDHVEARLVRRTAERHGAPPSQEPTPQPGSPDPEVRP